MNDEELKNALKSAYQVAEKKAPSFGETMTAAERRLKPSGMRLKVLGGLAAALVGALVFWPGRVPEPTDDFLIADSLMNSTSWIAPSDALMPEHQFDIYRETPFLNESTISPEGTLL